MQCFEKFYNAVEELYNNLSVYIPYMNQLQKLNNYLDLVKKQSCIDDFKLRVLATLSSQSPPYYMRMVGYFYEISFRVFCNLDAEQNLPQNDNLITEDVQCNGCLSILSQCRCKSIYEGFCNTNR